MGKWMKSLPYQNLKTSKDSVICQNTVRTSFDTESKKGKLRPRDPTSIWPGVAPSCIPTPAPLPRPTKRTSFTVRGTQPDEIDQIVEQYKVLFGNI